MQFRASVLNALREFHYLAQFRKGPLSEIRLPDALAQP